MPPLSHDERVHSLGLLRNPDRFHLHEFLDRLLPTFPSLTGAFEITEGRKASEIPEFSGLTRICLVEKQYPAL